MFERYIELFTEERLTLLELVSNDSETDVINRLSPSVKKLLDVKTIADLREKLGIKSKYHISKKELIDAIKNSDSVSTKRDVEDIINNLMIKHKERVSTSVKMDKDEISELIDAYLKVNKFDIDKVYMSPVGTYEDLEDWLLTFKDIMLEYHISLKVLNRYNGNIFYKLYQYIKESIDISKRSKDSAESRGNYDLIPMELLRSYENEDMIKLTDFIKKNKFFMDDSSVGKISSFNDLFFKVRQIGSFKEDLELTDSLIDTIESFGGNFISQKFPSSILSIKINDKKIKAVIHLLKYVADSKNMQYQKSFLEDIFDRINQIKFEDADKNEIQNLKDLIKFLEKNPVKVL